MAKRPYDLRHACVSTWLKAGIEPKRVAEWAGHSVEVLLRIYTHCHNDGEHKARLRIQKTLDAQFQQRIYTTPHLRAILGRLLPLHGTQPPPTPPIL